MPNSMNHPIYKGYEGQGEHIEKAGGTKSARFAVKSDATRVDNTRAPASGPVVHEVTRSIPKEGDNLVTTKRIRPSTPSDYLDKSDSYSDEGEKITDGPTLPESKRTIDWYNKR